MLGYYILFCFVFVLGEYLLLTGLLPLTLDCQGKEAGSCLVSSNLQLWNGLSLTFTSRAYVLTTMQHVN